MMVCLMYGFQSHALCPETYVIHPLSPIYIVIYIISCTWGNIELMFNGSLVVIIY
jgi:hypothetical protein